MKGIGVIETLAAETRELNRKEAARIASKERDASIRREAEERERTAEARVLAMRAARSLTGRVIFPARWTILPLEDNYRRCLRETSEGKVTIWVYVKSGYVNKIIVGNDAAGKTVEWTNPKTATDPARWPISPGRDWFRRALVTLGLI